MRVTIVASHLFEATHHGLAQLAMKLQSRVELQLFAKHPAAYPDPAVPVPAQLPRLTGTWRPAAEVVHCVGGGETAIATARCLDDRVPLVVSFTGAVDLTRQLSDRKLAAGYARLFERASVLTCPSGEDAARLEARGAPRERIEITRPVMPLEVYPERDSAAPRRAIFAARALPRKNAALALMVAGRAALLEELLAVGVDRIEAAGSRATPLGLISHAETVRHMRGCRALLLTSDWRGSEVDGLPVVMLEALAMGLVIVSTPIRGAVRLQAEFPLRVRIGTDEGSLAARLDEALVQDDTGLAEARAWVHENASAEAALEKLLGLYRRAAGGAR